MVAAGEAAFVEGGRTAAFVAAAFVSLGFFLSLRLPAGRRVGPEADEHRARRAISEGAPARETAR